MARGVAERGRRGPGIINATAGARGGFCRYLEEHLHRRARALDAALSRGPRTVDEFKRFDEAPVDDTAAPAPAAEALPEDGVKEAVVLVRTPWRRPGTTPRTRK